MKKTLTLLALMAAIGPAWGAEVVSSNVVGYQKLTLQAGYNLIANGFRVVGTENAPVLQNMFGDAKTAATGSVDIGSSDNLLTWTGTGYATYWFYDATGTEYEDADYDKKWYDVIDDSTPTSEGLSVADGAWYIARNATTLTVAGQVGTNSVEVALQDGYNLVANPFPADLTLNNLAHPIDWAGMGVTGGTDIGSSDNILVWTGTGYATYWFYDATGTEYEDADYDKKWYDVIDDSTPSDYAIPAGKGVWFIHRGTATTITLPSPL